MPRRHAPAALVVLLCIAVVPLHAQDVLAAAQAELKAATAGWLDELRLGLDYAREQFASELNEVLKEMQEDGYDIDQVEVVVDALDEFQGTIQGEVASVVEGCAASAADILGQVEAELFPPGSLPAEFAAGAGSTWDAFRATVRKDVDKTYATMRKRLGKYRKKLAALDVNLTFLLEPPRELPDVIVNPGSATEAELQPPGLDYVLAFSRAAEPEDGRLRLGGYGASEVSLEVFGVVTGVLDDIAPQPGSERWRAELGDYDLEQVEGTYLFRVSSTGEPPTDTEQITLR
jgi:hypothetical protein